MEAPALDHGGVGVWEINVLTEELLLDRCCCAFLGFSPGESVDLMSCLGRIHPGDREVMLGDLEKAILPGSGPDWNFEVRIIHPQHGVRWIVGFGKIERNADGTTLRVNGIALRLRENKLLDLSHRGSEEKYRKLFQSISDALVIVNMQGRIIECNQAYADLTGYSQEELFRLTYQDLTPEKWHAFEARIVSEQIIPNGYSATYEKEYMRKDGTTIPIELRTFLVRDSFGNPQQMWAIVRDISERKNSEVMMMEWNRSLERRVEERTSELEQSRARFKQLAETTFEAIVICENGIIEDGNRLLESMFGYELDGLIGRPVGDLAASSSKEVVYGQLLQGEDCSNEFTAMRADGTTFPVEAHAKNASLRGRNVKIVAIRDLTSTKAAEAKILAQQSQLADMQRLAIISEVAAGIIHQIGQPLCSIGANVMTALKSMESCTIASCQSIGYVRGLEADVDRMRQIVIHMRSLGDPTRAERKPCDLNQIIADVRPMLEVTARSRGASLRFSLVSELPLVHADSFQLGQVVLNLVKNAAEASAAESEIPNTVEIITEAVAPDWVQLTVSDQGAGIPDAVLERLFMPFFTTKSDGLGIGLRLCRTIVDAHGGDLICFNNPDGVGATFQVRLPVQSSQPVGTG